MTTEGSTRPASNWIGIWIVVLANAIRVVTVGAALLLETGALASDWLAQLSPIPVRSGDSAVDVILRVLLGIVLVVSALCIWGLVRRRPWGWTLSIVTAGIVLALNLGWWASGEPRYLSMLVNSVAVLFLNQREIRSEFGVHRG